jgi:maltose alpha-D-glucosyltransferase/alpha-amylase
VIYQVHVRSFADGAHDGVGDLAGLSGKRDYLQELGVTALWLLPVYPAAILRVAPFRRIDFATPCF